VAQGAVQSQLTQEEAALVVFESHLLAGPRPGIPMSTGLWKQHRGPQKLATSLSFYFVS
jgi:hypothetical protein